jgi:hypothetical protein
MGHRGYSKVTKVGRRKHKPRFPLNEDEYTKACRRVAGTNYYIDAILETPLGTLSAHLESSQNIVVSVNNQALKPEHFGLTVKSFIIRSINGRETQGWADEFRSNP